MITQSQFLEMQARCDRARNADREEISPDAVESESDLHDAILTECRKRFWPVVHARMDTRTTTAKGVPDFVIFADAGRVFSIECKSRTGKLSPEQLGWRLLLERKGHHYSVIRSFNEFICLIQSKPISQNENANVF